LYAIFDPVEEKNKMPTKVAYERVNLADIETSSDEDDYGDLFAHERRMGHGKSRPLRNLSKKKGGKCVSGSFCWKSLCVVSVVFAILGLLAGVAIYMDPESSFLDLMPMESTLGTSSTTQENSDINSSVGGGKNGSNMTTASISASGDNAEASLILTTLGGTSESMNNLTTTEENPGKEEEKALEEKKKRKKTNKVEEEDRSDKPAKSAKSSEAWSPSSFSFSASPEEDLLRLFSEQMASTSSQR